MTNIHNDKILILDFGAQYTQLIARRIREIGVYCEIWAWDHDPADIAAFNPKGIILSGGPESTTEAGSPRAPQQVITDGRIVSIYGSAVSFAGQNQVVSINKGERDGIESGHVLAILKNGETIIDRTGGSKETLKLPNERIGLLMVFRTFTKVSYALVLEITDTPRAGDLLANP